jgi:hypothetical protein
MRQQRLGRAEQWHCRYARLQSRGKEEQLRGRSSQRDLGSAKASPATAAAARQRESPGGAAVAQPDGSGTSRAGAAAVAGRGRASQAAASSFPAAGRRAPTPDIAAAERLGRRLAEVAEATVAAPEAPLILSQKEKEAGLAAAAAKATLQHARIQATTAREVAADNVRWRQARQSDAPAAYDGWNRHLFLCGI